MPELPLPYRLQHLAETGSTNDDCLELARDGQADGLVIVADRQTKGRGRQGRSWHTQPGSALAFTLLIRPNQEEQAYLGRFTALGGLALVKTLQKHGVSAWVKWPNDVLINARKVCGILAETVWQADKAQAIALGMGVNILQGSLPAETRLVYPASDIETETGLRFDRWELLSGLLQELSELRFHLPTPGFIAAWNANLAFQGEIAPVRDADGQMRAYQILGVEADAGLRVLAADGQEKVLYSAEISA